MRDGVPHKKRPTRSPEPPPCPCPTCGVPPRRLKAAKVEALDLDPDQVTIFVCKPCGKIAAHVDGIQDAWRDYRHKGDVDRVIQDGWDGLRQKHMLTSDESDPIWGLM